MSFKEAAHHILEMYKEGAKGFTLFFDGEDTHIKYDFKNKYLFCFFKSGIFKVLNKKGVSLLGHNVVGEFLPTIIPIITAIINSVEEKDNKAEELKNKIIEEVLREK